MEPLIKQEYLILAKDRERPLAIGRLIEGTERRNRVLKKRFVLKLKARCRQIVSAEAHVHTAIDRVSSSFVYRYKFKITERIKGGELWIDPGAVVIASFVGHALISDRVRDRLVYLLGEPERPYQQSVASTFVRIINVRVKVDAGDGFRESLPVPNAPGSANGLSLVRAFEIVV